MNRIAILVAAVIAAGTTVIAAATRVAPVDTVRDAVESDIRAATGLDLLMRGPISVSMFPVPSVQFSDVALKEAVAGEAARLVLGLRNIHDGIRREQQLAFRTFDAAPFAAR